MLGAPERRALDAVDATVDEALLAGLRPALRLGFAARFGPTLDGTASSNCLPRTDPVNRRTHMLLLSRRSHRLFLTYKYK